MMMSRRRISMHTELLLCAAYRMGRRMALRSMTDALAERDRSIAQMRAEFESEARELRALLQAAMQKVSYLQKLDAAMRSTPPPLLH
jgi:hypothetical protein